MKEEKKEAVQMQPQAQSQPDGGQMQTDEERRALRWSDTDAREAQLRERFAQLCAQFDAVRMRYPQAELAQELENPAFMRMVVRGMQAMQAYELAHFDELQRSAMAYGARRAREELTAAMQAGYLRPRESGLHQANGGAFAESPEQWSRQTRDELKTRARRGEKIRL